jgi:hypothetical protein
LDPPVPDIPNFANTGHADHKIKEKGDGDHDNGVEKVGDEAENVSSDT